MSPRRVLAITLRVLLLAPLVAMSPAPGPPSVHAAHTAVAAQSADPSGTAGYADRHVFAGYEERPVEVTQVAGGHARRPTRACVLWTVALAQITTGVHAMPLDEAALLSRLYRGELVEGQEYAILCYREGETGPYLVSFITYHRTDPTQSTITTIETVEQHARSLVTAPAPELVTTPPADRLVVGFETWFASPSGVAAQPRTAQAGPMWARADVVARAITFDTGDGGHLVCAADAAASNDAQDPNVDTPGCARHTYLDSRHPTGIGHFLASATVTYDVWLTTSEDSTPRLADTLDGPTTEVTLTVRSLQAVIR